jgi:hypothetical protein
MIFAQREHQVSFYSNHLQNLIRLKHRYRISQLFVIVILCQFRFHCFHFALFLNFNKVYSVKNLEVILKIERFIF